MTERPTRTRAGVGSRFAGAGAALGIGLTLVGAMTSAAQPDVVVTASEVAVTSPAQLMTPPAQPTQIIVMLSGQGGGVLPVAVGSNAAQSVSQLAIPEVAAPPASTAPAEAPMAESGGS